MTAKRKVRFFGEANEFVMNTYFENDELSRSYSDEASEGDSSLNCGSIESAEADDRILANFYGLIDREKKGDGLFKSLTLKFVDNYPKAEDFDRALTRKLEALYYRNFFDWDFRVFNYKQIGYLLSTQGRHFLLTAGWPGDIAMRREQGFTVKIRPIRHEMTKL